MKKLLAAVAGGSVAAFGAIFFQVAHFARNQVLFGDITDVEIESSATTFGFIKFIFALLSSMAVLLDEHLVLASIAFVIVGTAAVYIARAHLLDAVLLAGIAGAAIMAFIFFTAPWFSISKMIQSRTLHPDELIPGEGYLARSARENWTCLLCSTVKETRFQPLVCGSGHHDAASCRSDIRRQFAIVGAFTLLIVVAFGYVVFARGSWLDKSSPGSGFAKATLAALSAVCVIVLALNVYSTAYVYGKTVAGFDLERVHQIQDDFRSDALFIIAKSGSALTLMYSIDDYRRVELGNDIRIEAAGAAKNALAHYVAEIAEAELNQDNSF